MSYRIIEVVDFDPIWKKSFESEKIALLNAIGSNLVKIEHIGSTSVIGLIAKPVIDILVEVVNLESLDASKNDLETLKYIVKGENGIVGRRYFQKGGNQRRYHVHAFKTGNFNLVRYRAFKEYLIAHPIIASEYGQIKKKAVLNCENDINLYMAQKNDFIQKYVKLAIEWYGN
ncbi:MAG: GrpB family protein [Methylococcales bacterium]|nr:GrpB family protein [Methylococcales bacterium]